LFAKMIRKEIKVPLIHEDDKVFLLFIWSSNVLSRVLFDRTWLFVMFHFVDSALHFMTLIPKRLCISLFFRKPISAWYSDSINQFWIDFWHTTFILNLFLCRNSDWQLAAAQDSDAEILGHCLLIARKLAAQLGLENGKCLYSVYRCRLLNPCNSYFFLCHSNYIIFVLQAFALWSIMVKMVANQFITCTFMCLAVAPWPGRLAKSWSNSTRWS
jgi:hypothetical protein